MKLNKRQAIIDAKAIHPTNRRLAAIVAYADIAMQKKIIAQYQSLPTLGDISWCRR